MDYASLAINEYSDMVMRIAVQNMKNLSDAEDIAQEVFLRLIRQDAPPQGEHLKAWLIRVTINLCKDTWKSSWRKNTVPFDDAYSLSVLPTESQSVFKELWRLPKEDRNVIYLYYYEGYNVPEIAKIMKKNKSTISSRLTRAREKLGSILLEEGFCGE